MSRGRQAQATSKERCDDRATRPESWSIGGGYAGVIAANHLRLRPDVADHPGQPPPGVRRTDPAAPAGHRLRRRHRGLRRHPRRRHRAGGRRGHPHRHRRRGRWSCSAAQPLPYDYLIYAVGSGSAQPAVPGADEFAYPIADLEEAQRLTARAGRPALRRAGVRGRCRPDRYRDRRRAGRAGPGRHAGVRRRPRAVPEHAGPPVGGQAAAQARGRDRRRTAGHGDRGRPPTR